MTSKIAYSTNLNPERPDPPSGPLPETMVNRALEIALYTLNQAGMPHHIERRDDRIKPTETAIPLYGFYIRPAGPGSNCQPLYYGWAYDPAEPWTQAEAEHPELPRWSADHVCDTSRSRNFTATHMVIAEIVARWQNEGLITSVKDATQWLETKQPRRLAAAQGRTIASIRLTIDTYHERLAKSVPR